jgi:hypothetical protein
MDLYIVLFQVYSDYNLEQIEYSKKNIRNLFEKILKEKMVKYFPYLENFLKILVFKIIDNFYNNRMFEKYELNNYIVIYLQKLHFHGLFNRQNINVCINFYDEELLKQSAKILCSIKQREEEEENTIGRIDPRQ